MCELVLNSLTPRQLQAIGIALDDPELVINGGTEAKPETVVTAAHVMGELPEKTQIPAGTVLEIADDNKPLVGVGTTIPAEPSPEEVFSKKTQEPRTEETAADGGFAASIQETTVNINDVAAPSTQGDGEYPELDSAGNAWDERVHARTKTKIADGTWKLKRGVSPALVQQVLGGDMPQGAATAEPTPTQAAPTATTATYAEVMGKITHGIAGQEFTPPQVSQVLNNNGVASTAALKDRPELFDTVISQLEALGGGN